MITMSQTDKKTKPLSFISDSDQDKNQYNYKTGSNKLIALPDELLYRNELLEKHTTSNCLSNQFFLNEINTTIFFHKLKQLLVGKYRISG